MFDTGEQLTSWVSEFSDDNSRLDRLAKIFTQVHTTIIYTNSYSPEKALEYASDAVKRFEQITKPVIK